MRLDQAVAARYPEVSRRKARELIAARRVLVNERLVAVASREVEPADRIVIVDENPGLRVLAETLDWLAIDKPPGLPTQPTKDRQTISLEEVLRSQYREIYLVHRIDTPTSGVVLFARNKAAAASLSELFATGAIRKTYLAMTSPPVEVTLTLEAPIEGRAATTHVRPLNGSLCEVVIDTGRRHQIRIHLSAAGHPVAGDKRYDGAPAPRLMLHAWKVEHASLGTITAPLPVGFPPL